MECNKDEALRAKSIAEGKLDKRDFVGARKFALKAQNLFPALDGISHMLTTIDVYISAENKINGEVDWYGVLGLNPSVDDDAIKKQYRKLALMLHPDKNKSFGADGAFTLISEAFGMLSDKTKRLAYNQRRGLRIFHQKVHLPTGGPPSAPPPHTGNGVFNCSSKTSKTPKSQNKSTKTPPPPKPAPKTNPSCQRTDTFWTICHRCKMQYEYLKMYLNRTLLCNNCKVPFMASATPPPQNFPKSSNQVPKQREQSSSNHKPSQTQGRNMPAAQKTGAGQAGPSSFKDVNFQRAPLPGKTDSSVGAGPNLFRNTNYQPGPLHGKTDPSIGAKTVHIVHQAQEKLKRAYDTESQREEQSVKKRKLDDYSTQFGAYNNVGMGNGGFGSASANANASALGSRNGGFGTKNASASGSGLRFHGFPGFSGFSSPYHQPNTSRDLTQLETRKMLMGNARKEILKKLSVWGPKTTPEAAGKEKTKEKNTKIHNEERKAKQEETRRVGHSADSASIEHSKPESLTMTVPDSDFHDFDQDRTESTFGDNEVWSAYDDDDGMPRFYALINKVISTKPFKLKISWLNSKTNTEFSELTDWVGSGFYKTCGEFRVGKYEVCKSINAFSQKVNWMKGPRGSVLILPQKGDVWALYRNWSFDWNEKTSDEVVHKYEMAMVLDDYSEENGLSIAPLFKVVGFRTVFRPNLDNEVVKRVPKKEMFRFSHRVPHHLLTRQEAQNVPEGCLELDPAATPLELLQKVPETNGAQRNIDDTNENGRPRVIPTAQ